MRLPTDVLNLLAAAIASAAIAGCTYGTDTSKNSGGGSTDPTINSGGGHPTGAGGEREPEDCPGCGMG